MNFPLPGFVRPEKNIVHILTSIKPAKTQFVTLTFSICLLAGAAKTLAFDLQELAAPPQTQLSWVGKHIVQNGMPMQILQLQSSLPQAELLRFYRQEWEAFHKPGERSSITRDVGEWRMLSTLVDAHHVVLQLKREGSQLTGFLSSTPLDTRTEQSSITTQFPRQSGSQLISSTESNDGGVKATTLILQNRYSLRDSHNFYKTALQREGWKLARSNVARGTAVMLFDSPSGSLQLAMRRDKDKTFIFANLRSEEI